MEESRLEKTTLFGQKCVPKMQDLFHTDNPLFSVAGTGQTKARESLVYSQNTEASLPPGWTRALQA